MTSNRSRTPAILTGRGLLMRTLLAAAVVMAAASFAQAGKVKGGNHAKPADHDRAVMKQLVVSSEGNVRLSRQLKPLGHVEANHVWDVVEDGAGNLIVATGDDGKLFKVTPDGKAS